MFVCFMLPTIFQLMDFSRCPTFRRFENLSLAIRVALGRHNIWHCNIPHIPTSMCSLMNVNVAMTGDRSFRAFFGGYDSQHTSQS